MKSSCCVGVLQSCHIAQLETTTSKGFWSNSSYEGKKCKGGHIHVQKSVKSVLVLGKTDPLFRSALSLLWRVSWPTRSLEESLPPPHWLLCTHSTVIEESILRFQLHPCLPRWVQHYLSLKGWGLYPTITFCKTAITTGTFNQLNPNQDI